MNERDFCYWLQGFIELTCGKEPPTKEQWKSIQEHLALVFNKVTPEVKSDEQIPSLSDLLKDIAEKNKHKEVTYPPITIPTPWRVPDISKPWPWDPNFPPTITC